MTHPQRTLLTLALLVPLAGIARGGTGGPDHLKCHQTKDAGGKATYTADLVSVHPSFPSETGCQIKLPAKMICFPVGKNNVTPAPPGAPHGANLFEKLACYKLKCPKQELALAVTDQFGSRTMAVKAPSILCAPFDVD